MLKRWVSVAICVMLLVSVGSAAAQGGSLLRLLNQVPDNTVSRTSIWYGALGELNSVLGLQINSLAEVNALPPGQRTAYLFEVGMQVYYSNFSGVQNPDEWRQVFGINPFSIQRELTVGRQQSQYAILEGNFDPNAVMQALQGLGYQPVQIGGATVYALGDDNSSDANNVAQRLAGPRFNRVVIAPNQIVAAQSTQIIESLVQGGSTIANNDAYRALASVLDDPNTVPGTVLLSGVLFDGAFLAQNIANRPPDAGQLPPYEVAGFGYRRSREGRVLVIALVYRDPGQAAQAANELQTRLSNYASMRDGRRLFEGWAFNAGVLTIGSLQVAIIAAPIPDQTDVAWVELVFSRDIAFLATP